MNKQIIEEYTEDVWNKKNTSVILDYFKNNAKIHSPLGNFRSPQQMREIVEKWITALPDIQVEMVHTFEENDIVISHWKACGTHKNELNGIFGKGNPVSYQGVTLYRMENGKISEYWAYVDTWTLEQQMKKEHPY